MDETEVVVGSLAPRRRGAGSRAVAAVTGSMELEVRLLGPVEARTREHAVPIGGVRGRTVLAALAVNVGHVVPVDSLVDAVWGPTPPATARAQIQTCISTLRRAFRGVIITKSPGYSLDVDSTRVDAHLFEALATEARRAKSEGRLGEAEGILRRALELWRGPAFGGIDGLSGEAARLEELRLAIIEERVDIDLTLGRDQDVVAELSGLVTQHPLRERLRYQLMLALYRCGRQADALGAYRDARATLVDELGLEPGPDLRRLEGAILAGEPALEALPREGDAPASSWVLEPGSSLLPPRVQDFVGRDAQELSIRQLFAESTAKIVALNGPAGIGKTALAIHVAHLLRPAFPDGQLHVDLRGPTADPVDSKRVLQRWLAYLGVPEAAIPSDPDAQLEMYRSKTADRRMLIVLDGAAEENQVRSLLPGGASGVLITSRSRLTGLEGSSHIDIEPFSEYGALELLGRILGAERLAAEPLATDEIVRLCGRLPLAIRIAGARLAARPHWPLHRLAARLRDERRRLDELVHGDLDLRANTEPTYRGLNRRAARAFRLLGLLGPVSFGVREAAELLDAPTDVAEDFIEQLADARLIDVSDTAPAERVRYCLSELPRIYAIERAHEEEALADREAALARASFVGVDVRSGTTPDFSKS